MGNIGIPLLPHQGCLSLFYLCVLAREFHVKHPRFFISSSAVRFLLLLCQKLCVSHEFQAQMHWPLLLFFGFDFLWFGFVWLSSCKQLAFPVSEDWCHSYPEAFPLAPDLGHFGGHLSLFPCAPTQPHNPTLTDCYHAHPNVLILCQSLCCTWTPWVAGPCSSCLCMGKPLAFIAQPPVGPLQASLASTSPQ